MAKQIRVVPYGNLGNQMFQYMVARALQERVPSAEIVGVDMPAWGLDSTTADKPRGRFSIGIHRHQFPFERVVDLLRDERSIDVFIQRPCSRLEYWQQHLDLFRREFAPPGGGVGGGADELVINVRSAEILAGKRDGGARHGNYIPVPIDLYTRLLDRTGLTPVFVGQVESNSYTEALRDRFGGSEFISHDTVLGDFEYLRHSVNVVTCVSTYSWLAAWLSTTATSVFLPVMGLFNPRGRPDIDLVPTGDPRYTLLGSELKEWGGSAEELEALISSPASSFGFDLP